MAAIKKSQLYSSLWESSDALRGGMDASQYKDYILTLLFVKYVTDKFKDEPYADIIIPDGGSFDDMVSIIGDKERSKNIGEEMDKIIAKLAEANNLRGVIDNAHFNDETKIGKGQEMVDKLTKLINIFRKPELNFKNNRAEGDDIIGDAYEYLMRKFATESGKSKGQFYTPAEVSRVLAKVIGISKETNPSATVYDPACGSGSLLIRALDEAKINLAGYGQEKDTTTAGLATMNTVLHGRATTIIKADNTFSNPQYFEDNETKEVLKRFDYIVANPPFSTKNWKDGLKEYGRFDGYGEMPPEKNGDYAWLLHIIKSLKNNGKAAVILPHGVLFRGNAEATIRKNIISNGKCYIKGIIGLPSNLFYGTGIPACIIVLDKQNADTRDSIFMIDASHGYVKDGNKNRLREQDVYKIVNTFNNEITDDKKYARKVPISEIISPQNDCNLNLPRYIDSSSNEGIQDINAHLNGGIPSVDIDSMHMWDVFPKLKNKLFHRFKKGYYGLNVSTSEIRNVIFEDEEFVKYTSKVDEAFDNWKVAAKELLNKLDTNTDVKSLIISLSELLLEKFEEIELLDKYDIYQVLLAYWQDIMADDVYLVSHGGFETAREIDVVYQTKKSKDESGKEAEVKTDKVKSWEGQILPKSIIISEYFADEQASITNLINEQSSISSQVEEMIESASEGSEFFNLISNDNKVKDADVTAKINEIRAKIKSSDIDDLESLMDTKIGKKDIELYCTTHPALKFALTDKGTITKTSLKNAIIEIRNSLPIPEQYKEDYDELMLYTSLKTRDKECSDKLKQLSSDLDEKTKEKYTSLGLENIKKLVINEKWINFIQDGIKELFKSISGNIANDIGVLAKRYETTLGEIDDEIDKASRELSSLVGELEADEFDMNGLTELKKLLDDEDKVINAVNQLDENKYPKAELLADLLKIMRGE